jgi:hypothetical protein
LESIPIRLQLSLVQLGPRFHETFLPPWQGAGNQFDRLDAENTNLVR